MTIVLTHFSKEPFMLKEKDYPPRSEYKSKPSGLWLSDESGEDGWGQWCRSEDFQLEHLTHRQEFECDTTNWLVLKSEGELRGFTQKYGMDYPGGLSFLRDRTIFINWVQVKKEYSGILITPYQWGARMDLLWYYGWDCASGCAWDLTTIKLK